MSQTYLVEVPAERSATAMQRTRDEKCGKSDARILQDQRCWESAGVRLYEITVYSYTSHAVAAVFTVPLSIFSRLSVKSPKFVDSQLYRRKA